MSDHHHIVTPKTYGTVLMMLMGLMALTILAARVHIGSHDQHLFNLLVALLIAFGKVSLIMSFFMHVKYGSNLTRIFAVAGFFWMIIFITLLFADYMGRVYGSTPIVPNPYGV